MRRLFSFVLIFALSGYLLLPASAATISEGPAGGSNEIKNYIVADYPVEEAVEAINQNDGDGFLGIANEPAESGGGVDNVIVLDLGDISALDTVSNIEVPANTVVYVTSATLTTIDIDVEYMPTNVNIYYGISKYADGTGSHWDNIATGGSGSTSITPGSTRSYYIYIANMSNKLVYADLSYQALISLDEGT